MNIQIKPFEQYFLVVLFIIFCILKNNTSPNFSFPITGEAPDDPLTGFLPPNNGTSGQGYVTFTVGLKKNLPSLARIDAKASIYFDKNEPIDTPPIFNTVQSLL